VIKAVEGGREVQGDEKEPKVERWGQYAARCDRSGGDIQGECGEDPSDGIPHD